MAPGEQSSLPETTSVESPSTPSADETKRQNRDMIIAGIIALFFVLLLIGFFVFLLLPSTDPELVVRFKNIFIIYLALETILIGAVIVILIVQVARFTNFLKRSLLSTVWIIAVELIIWIFKKADLVRIAKVPVEMEVIEQ